MTSFLFPSTWFGFHTLTCWHPIEYLGIITISDIKVQFFQCFCSDENIIRYKAPSKEFPAFPWKFLFNINISNLKKKSTPIDWLFTRNSPSVDVLIHTWCVSICPPIVYTLLHVCMYVRPNWDLLCRRNVQPVVLRMMQIN